MLVIDEYLASRVLVGARPDQLVDDELTGREALGCEAGVELGEGVRAR